MIESEIINEIANLTRIKKEELDVSTKLYNSNIVSSLQMLDLISRIEEKFKIVIRPEELYEENFKDVSALSNLIRNKSGV